MSYDVMRNKGLMMKRINGVVIALAMMFVIGGCGGEGRTATTTADPGGRLFLPETYYDFGAVAISTRVEHAFVVENTGSGPLNLGKADVKLLEGC